MSITIITAAIAASAVVMTSFSVGISQGKTYNAALRAIDIQPSAKDDIAKLALLGSALIETTTVLAVFMTALLALDHIEPCDPFFSELSKLGIGFAICLAGITVGWVSGNPAQQACLALARQPLMGQKIFNFMLLTLSIIQTPLILAFIVALFIKTQAAASMYLADSLRLIASGLAIGLGSVGPAFGLSLFASKAIQGLGTNRHAYNRLLIFTFISQAIIDAPIVFSLLISLVLLLMGVSPTQTLSGINLLAAGLCIGLGTIGSGISSGRIAAAACEQITKNPDNYSILSRTSIFGQGIIDTMAIYALVIAFFLIFIV